jgi:hypothetical protein
LTKAQVEKSPNIDTDQPVSRQHEIEYYRYYGYPSYWSGPYLWGGYPFPVMSSDQATLESERRWEWGTEESGDRHRSHDREMSRLASSRPGPYPKRWMSNPMNQLTPSR